MKNWKDQKTADLFEAILKLKDGKECELFFRDLCTLREIRSMSDRWDVVQLLDRGISYREINKRTGVSTATITRIAHWLNNGEGGYQLLLDRLK